MLGMGALGGLGQIAAQPQPRGGFLQQLGGALFQAPEGMQVDPRMLQQQQQQALLTLGLGMLAGKERGEGFGQSALRGLGAAQGNFQGALQQGYQNTMANRRESREDAEVSKRDARYDQDRKHAMEREKLDDERQARRDALAEREAAQMGDVRAAQAASARALAADRAAALKAQGLDQTRARQLMQKPGRTPEEDLELDALTGGAVSRLLRAQRSGLGWLGSFAGGQPAMGGAAMLMADPDL